MNEVQDHLLGWVGSDQFRAFQISYFRGLWKVKVSWSENSGEDFTHVSYEGISPVRALNNMVFDPWRVDIPHVDRLRTR